MARTKSETRLFSGKIYRRPPDCERPAFISVPMPPVRLLVVAGLAVAGALSAATAASVYTASLPMREAHAGEGRHPWTAEGWLRPDSLVALASNPRRSAAQRLVALDLVVAGACLAPREMLFGADASRWLALKRVAAALREVPGQAPAYHSARHILQQFSRGDTHAFSESPKHVGEHVVQLVLPDILLERVHLCRRLRLR